MRRNFTKYITSEYIEAATQFTTARSKVERRIMVYVEGYDDIAFWRGVLSPFENEKLCFEVNVPTRDDLAKGKKVLLGMAKNLGDNLILCMDSDFDYLFQGKTEQSAKVLNSKYIVHTYAYAIENHRCNASSLHGLCVKITKNDREVFNFEHFMARYSSAIFPLFLWYAYSALSANTRFFILANFKSAVNIGFVDVRSDGRSTIDWVRRSATDKLRSLEKSHPEHIKRVKEFGVSIAQLGVTRQNCYLYMNGHVLKDNVMVLLGSVTDLLKEMIMENIRNSSRKGAALDNEISNYKNSIRNIKEVINDNENFKSSDLFKMMERDIKNIIG